VSALSLALTICKKRWRIELRCDLPASPRAGKGAGLCSYVTRLKNAKVKVGLSWSSLSKAVGHEAILRVGCALFRWLRQTKDHTKEVNVLSKKLRAPDAEGVLPFEESLPLMEHGARPKLCGA